MTPARFISTVFALALAFTAHGRAAAMPPYIVRCAYVVPADREPVPEAAGAYRVLIEDIRAFFRSELARQGFGARTFAVERDARGLPVLHTVRPDADAATLSAGTTREHHDRLIDTVKAAGHPVDAVGQVWLILSESSTQGGDGSELAVVALGIRGRRDGNDDNGIAVRTGPVLALVRAGALSDDRPLIGAAHPPLGPHTITRDAVAWYEHDSLSAAASSTIGAVAHELGHAFGLLHGYTNDGLWDDGRQQRRGVIHFGTLMGNGFRAWRSWREPSAFHTPDAPEFLRLSRASAELLALSPFFGGSDPTLDPTEPECDVTMSTDTLAADGLVRFTIRAADPESGVRLVEVYNGRQVAASVAFNDAPASIDHEIETAIHRPGEDQSWRVRVFNGAFREAQRWFRADIPDDAPAGSRPFIVAFPAAIPVGRPVRFDGESKTRGDGIEPDAFSWSLGDGATARGGVVEHAFDAPGLYTVRLTVADGAGVTRSVEETVRVTPGE